MRKTMAGFCLGGLVVGWILFCKPIEALLFFASMVLVIQGIKEEYHYVGRKKDRNKI